MSKLSPNHFIDYTRIRLNYFDNLSRNVFIGIIGHGDSAKPFLSSSTAVSTACSNDFSSIPASTKHPLSRASGRSVEVLMQTAGKLFPTEVKKLLSSGSVPLSETTAKEFI